MKPRCELRLCPVACSYPCSLALQLRTDSSTAPWPQKESSEMSLRQDPHFSAFSKTASASLTPEAVNPTGDSPLGALWHHSWGLDWEQNQSQFGTGRVYWKLPFAMTRVGLFLPLVSPVSGGQRRGAENQEEELRSLTLLLFFLRGFEVLFLSWSVLEILRNEHS